MSRVPSRFSDRRYAGGDAIVRDIADYDSVGSDDDIIAHFDGTQHLRAGADVDVIADHGCAGLIDALQSDNDAVADAAVIAELGIAADHDPAEMIDDKVMADLNLARQLDPGDHLNPFERDFVKQRENLTEERRSNLVAPPSEAIDDQCPKALGSPVATVGSQIFSNVVEHVCYAKR
jgi:hypothetical protein